MDQINDALDQMYRLGQKHAIELCQKYGADLVASKIYPVKRSNCCSAGVDEERSVCNECKEPCDIETEKIPIPIIQGRDAMTRAAADYQETRSY